MTEQAITTRRVLELFDAAWTRRYGKPYVFAKKHGPLAHFLISHWPDLTAAALVHAVERYVADDDHFLVQRVHPFELFAASNRINQYRVGTTGAAPATAQQDRLDRAGREFLDRLGAKS